MVAEVEGRQEPAYRPEPQENAVGEGYIQVVGEAGELPRDSVPLPRPQEELPLASQLAPHRQGRGLERSQLPPLLMSQVLLECLIRRVTLLRCRP